MPDKRWLISFLLVILLITGCAKGEITIEEPPKQPDEFSDDESDESGKLGKSNKSDESKNKRSK